MPVNTNYTLTIPEPVVNLGSNQLNPISPRPQSADSISSADSNNSTIKDRTTIYFINTGRLSNILNSILNFLQSIPFIGSFFKKSGDDRPIMNFKDFYNNVMTLEQKNQLKQQIYINNGSSSVFDGHDHEIGFGDYMIHHHSEHSIVRDAFNALKTQIGS